jgi:hypothetical protein
MNAMKIPFTGGCVCGEVRYECTAAPTMMFNCHCRDCQQTSGGPYAPVVALPLAAFKITKGSLKRYATTRLSGKPNWRGFCANCGSTLTDGENAERNIIGVIAVSLDDPSWFKPTMDLFVCDTQPWHILDPQLPKYQEYAPRK